MNLERKTGKVFDANIFLQKIKLLKRLLEEKRTGGLCRCRFHKDHFYLSGGEIEKRGRTRITAPRGIYGL